MHFAYFIFIFKHILINVFEEGTSHPQIARTQSRIKKLGAAAIGDGESKKALTTADTNGTEKNTGAVSVFKQQVVTVDVDGVSNDLTISLNLLDGGDAIILVNNDGLAIVHRVATSTLDGQCY